jgi:lipoate-protein ligase A
VDDFRKSGLPGILLDIDNTTCYDLDQAREAYAGKFESQTRVDLDLLETVLRACPKDRFSSLPSEDSIEIRI